MTCTNERRIKIVLIRILRVLIRISFFKRTTKLPSHLVTCWVPTYLLIVKWWVNVRVPSVPETTEQWCVISHELFTINLFTRTYVFGNCKPLYCVHYIILRWSSIKSKLKDIVSRSRLINNMENFVYIVLTLSINPIRYAQSRTWNCSLMTYTMNDWSIRIRLESQRNLRITEWICYILYPYGWSISLILLMYFTM